MEQNEIIELLSGMTVKQLADLASALEEEWGVTAAAAVAMVGPGGGGGDAAAAEEEKTEFDVVLTDFGAKKIGVIKVVREATGLGLKEAKELVEGAPSTIKEAVSADEAKDLVEKIEGAGGKAEAK